MTEQQVSAGGEENQTAGGGEALTPLPPRSLTIPAKRLSGSPACLNCGSELVGPFCHYCGQPDKNLLRFFPVLLRELLTDFLDLDSRFARTMKPLLLHPGKLTRDYLDGRRFRYTPPLRLYIFASMAFFLIAAMLAGSAITIQSGEDGQKKSISLGGGDSVSAQIEQGLDDAISSGEMTEADAAEIRQLMKKTGITQAVDDSSPETPDELENQPAVETSGDEPDLANEPGENSVDFTADVDGNTISLNGKPWNRETNPVDLPWVPDFINNWINDEIEGSPQKGREIEANPDIIIDKIMDVLPVAVFIMLPLVALLLKFWYLFSGHYYVEHLIHALHNHAFLFVIFILAILADALAKVMEPETEGIWTQMASWIDVVLLVWIPLYLLISLKKVYQQNWFMTLAKFSLIGISYMILLVAVAGTTALAGFILL